MTKKAHTELVAASDEHQLEDDVKKLLGLPPYNSPSNFCWNDNYYARSLQEKYGEVRFTRMCNQLQREKP